MLARASYQCSGVVTMLVLVLALLQAAGLCLGTTHLSYQGGQPGPSHRCHALPRPLTW